MTSQPSPELTAAVEGVPPGRALDLACGGGRHALWLAGREWKVTAADIVPVVLPGIEFIHADIEKDGLPVAADDWDLIVSWLYWQANLLPCIMAGVRPGGLVALAGKTSGRFATSLDNYRRAFPGWTELAAGEDASRAYFIARRSG